MIAYKGFNKGLVCLGYQFKMGLNVTQEANCRQNGFHCAEDPLDCLSYYTNMDTSEYFIVNVGGDVHEDGTDTKISCTELTIIKKLSRKEFVMHALAFIADHPKREWNSRVSKDRAMAANYHKFAIARGRDPIACGPKGSIIAFAKEDEKGTVIQVALAEVDDVVIKANTWYGVDLVERKGVAV